jgi:hypothetical protein
MTNGAYPDEYPPKEQYRRNAFWNLLLLIPLIALFPPFYNRTDPRLFGMPFFYWFLLALIALSAACTYVVYRMTKDEFVVTDGPDLLSVDSLDEGARR